MFCARFHNTALLKGLNELRNLSRLHIDFIFLSVGVVQSVRYF